MILMMVCSRSGAKPTIIERRYSMGLVVKGYALGIVQGSSITTERLFGSLLTHILIRPSGPASPGCVRVGACRGRVSVGIWRCVAAWLLIAVVGMDLSGRIDAMLAVMFWRFDVALCSSWWRIVSLLGRIAGAGGWRVGLLITMRILTVRSFFCLAFTCIV